MLIDTNVIIRILIGDNPEITQRYLTDNIELKLVEADYAADLGDERYTAEDVFGRIRKRIHERKAL